MPIEFFWGFVCFAATRLLSWKFNFFEFFPRQPLIHWIPSKLLHSTWWEPSLSICPFLKTVIESKCCILQTFSYIPLRFRSCHTCYSITYSFKTRADESGKSMHLLPSKFRAKIPWNPQRAVWDGGRKIVVEYLDCSDRWMMIFGTWTKVWECVGMTGIYDCVLYPN